MTLSININIGASALGGLGVGLMTSAGNPWSVADALARNGYGARTPLLQMPLTPARLWEYLQAGPAF